MKRVLILLSLLLVIIILFGKLNFHKQGIRDTKELNIPIDVKTSVIENTQNMNSFEIAEYCSEMTCDLLTYSLKQDELFINKPSKAHCVTYARICSELCNIAYKTHGLNSSTKSVYGYFTYFEVNINKVLTTLSPKNYKRYLKNHDVVELCIEDKTYWLDPTLHDLINFSKVKEY